MLKSKVSTMIYNISQQQEKVEGSIRTIIDEVYITFSKERKDEILEDVIKGLKRYK